jgi:predicted porin
MKRTLIAILLTMLMAPAANAVTEAEDIATTIKLRGYDCGGRAVSNISETQDAQGNRTIKATCPNGVRYQITVSSVGRMNVQSLK